jgi:hypothetical protein
MGIRNEREIAEVISLRTCQVNMKNVTAFSKGDYELPPNRNKIYEFLSIKLQHSLLNWETSGKIAINIQIIRLEEALYGYKG